MNTIGPWDRGLCLPDERYIVRAREIAAQELGVRGVAELSGRLEHIGDIVLLYTWGVVEVGVAFQPDPTWCELAGWTDYRSAASTDVLAIFEKNGDVFVQEKHEHCVAVLLPAILVASLVFPTAHYDVTWKRQLPSARWDVALRTVERCHPGHDWRVEPVRYKVTQGVVTNVL